MILIPFFWDTTNKDWARFGIFLCSGGREVWSVDDSDTESEIRSMLLENGFPVLEFTKTDGVMYARIDHIRLKLSHFYLWDQVNPKKSEEDVWRIIKIPRALWSCDVFKEQFWKTACLPIRIGLCLV